MTRISLQRIFPRALVALFLATSLGIPLLNGQPASEPKFVFETGKPAWAGERIELPPSFAPDLGWKGVEQIRFAPGMFQADAKDFFTYVLVFLLEPKTNTSEGALKQELLNYYKGLAEAVMKGKGKTIDTSSFTFSLKKASTLANPPASAQNVTAYTATLQWVEPFATEKNQTLQFEIHCWEHVGRPVVLSSVSPLDRNRAEWTQLRKIRERFQLIP